MSEYENEKNKILIEAQKRAELILAKYKNNNSGILDGEPWKEELQEDSKLVIKQLKQLDIKYKK